MVKTPPGLPPEYRDLKDPKDAPVQEHAPHPDENFWLGVVAAGTVMVIVIGLIWYFLG